MTGILIGIILALIMFNISQYRLARGRDAHLFYIRDKLRTIIEKNQTEKVLLFTNDPALKNLLVELNRLLEKKNEEFLKHAKKEVGIRKMLANISHDLKTPLTVVIGLIETIVCDKEMTKEARKQTLLKVQTKTSEILQLINKFFDLARLESGDKALPLTYVNINEICKNNLLFHYNDIESAGLEAIIDIPDQPMYALGNEEALDRILQNLISNAVRYGKEGLTVGLTLRGDDSHVYIDVWDRGKGIGESHSDKVFERMYTLEDSRTDSIKEADWA